MSNLKRLIFLSIGLLLAAFGILVIEDKEAARLLAISLAIGAPLTFLTYYLEKERQSFKNRVAKRKRKPETPGHDSTKFIDSGNRHGLH